MEKYFQINKVARDMIMDHMRINENDGVLDLSQKMVHNVFSAFKKGAFDYAPAKHRKVSAVKTSLKEIGGSSTLKNLFAKMKESFSDSEISNSKYANAKALYKDFMEKGMDALSRVVEIDPKMESKIIKNFQDTFSGYTSKMKEETSRETSLNESSESSPISKESVRRTKEKLEKILIPESVGKTPDNGYGRAWTRIFSDLDQRLSAILADGEISGESERKAFKTIQSQTEKLAKEFYSYCIKATEGTFKKINADEETAKKFNDIEAMVMDQMSILARANAEEENAENKIKQEEEEAENKITAKIFPLKQGDNDDSKRLKDSGIIKAIQKALINSFDSVKDLLGKSGGSDGVYTPQLEVAVKSIQSVMGNKNVSGQIDRPMLDLILNADTVSSKDKERISKALDVLRDEYIGESLKALDDKPSHKGFMSLKQFLGEEKIDESSIHIDNEKLKDEIEKLAAELPEQEKGAKKGPAGTSSDENFESKASLLAKLLRQKGMCKDAEDERFIREDGTLKSSYTPEFIDAWIKVAEESDSNSVPSYFLVEYDGNSIDGIYASKRLSSTSKKPCNWPKWKQIIGEYDSSDLFDFVKWYAGYYSNLGGLSAKERYALAKEIVKENGEKGDDHEKVYDKLYKAFSSESYYYGFINEKGMESVMDAFKRACQIDEKEKDMKASDFALLANLVSLISTAFMYDKEAEEFVPVIEHITKKVLSNSVIDAINADKVIDTTKDSYLQLSKEGISKSATKQAPKEIFKKNLNRAKEVHLPALRTHISRMNSKNAEDLSRDARKGIFIPR